MVEKRETPGDRELGAEVIDIHWNLLHGHRETVRQALRYDEQYAATLQWPAEQVRTRRSTPP